MRFHIRSSSRRLPIGSSDYPRFHFDAPVRVQGKAIGKKPASGRIIEISACGLSAVIARRIEVGEVVELQFALNGRRYRFALRYAIGRMPVTALSSSPSAPSSANKSSAARTLAASRQED